MLVNLQATRPPGDADIAPSWRIAEAREQGKQEYLQNMRIGRAANFPTTVAANQSDDSILQYVPPRRRNRPRAKPKATPGGATTAGAASAATKN